MVNREELSKIVIKLRNKKGYSQRKLAMVSGVSNSTISRIENATSDTDPETLKKLAPCLDISYEELMKAAGYMKEYSNITKETLSDEGFKKILPAVIEALSEIIPNFDLTFEKLDDDSKVKLYNSVVKNTKHIDDSKNTEPVTIDLVDIDSTGNQDIKTNNRKELEFEKFFNELKEEMVKEGINFDETSPKEWVEVYKVLKEFKKNTKSN
ncbi:helix-turn-helix domain-containing protein [Tissierella praeacuta]|uniref:helix-turn-helix domain-containing protein n=1 Tax=Tissierella praeacuta TaxID=43131 RepID=UPI0028AA784B|nr:helix-turn-helix transcriptional regulator [Tissierella praeacuta]